MMDQAQGGGTAGLDFQVPRFRLHPGQVHGVQFLRRQVRIQERQGLPVLADSVTARYDEDKGPRRAQQRTQRCQEDGLDGAIQPRQGHVFMVPIQFGGLLRLPDGSHQLNDTISHGFPLISTSRQTETTKKRSGQDHDLFCCRFVPL